MEKIKFTVKRVDNSRIIECQHAGKEFTFPLMAGLSDYIEARKEGKSLFILSDNYRLGYIGMEEFSLETAEKLSDCFFQDADEFSPGIMEKTDGYKIRRLINHLEDMRQ